nr:MAG TPA: hypothetical protein [Caudoviricetes sp.]
MRIRGAYHPLSRSLDLHTVDCTNFLTQKRSKTNGKLQRY